MKFKAMTYNICSGKNLARERDLNFAASVIRNVQPDFVTLNEVRCHTDDVPLHQAQELGRLTGYYPVFGKSIDIMNGEYGNAFLTRFPLLEYAVVHIPDRRNEEKAFYEHRSVLRCVLDVGGKNVTVLSTHFGLAKVEQESAVETVMKILDGENNPVILMGDLNMSPDDATLDPLFSAMHDTASRSDEIKTFPSGTPESKIDYIFCTDPISTVSLCSINTQCSDHRPLIAELKIDT